MAHETGIPNKGMFSKKLDWDYFKKYLDSMKLIKHKLNNKMKIYKSESNYFLVNKYDEYLGHIQYSEKDDIIKIETSNSELQKGFYEIMFTAILGSGVKEIISDTALSTLSIKSYINMSRKISNFELAIKTNKGYKSFSKEELLNGSNVVSIKQSHNLEEMFRDYYNKIDPNSGEVINKIFIPGTYLKMYNEDHEGIGFLLYHQDWDKI